MGLSILRLLVFSFLKTVGKGPLPGVASPQTLPSSWLIPTRLKYEPGAILVPGGRVTMLAARPERHLVPVLAGHPEHHQASGLSPRVLRELYPSYTSLVD